VSASASILVLEHIECEPAAAYGDELRQRGLRPRRVLLAQGQPLPDWRGFAGIVAMGGPMGAYDDALYPWLTDEKRLIAEAVRAGAPYWGVCLGAQLLAASLGAAVTPGERPEVGVAPVTLTPEATADPVFCAAPPAFEALHWHGDTYDLPTGATRLAGSAQYEQQAFVFGRAYALQFHLEVPATLAGDWVRVPAYRDSLEQVMGRLAAVERRTTALARLLFGRWLQQVAELDAGRGAQPHTV
jgi:GMP synthase (glutamine-hydrolysing)